MLAGGRGVPIRLAAPPAPAPPWHAPLAHAPAYHPEPQLRSSPFSAAGSPVHPLVQAQHAARQRQIVAEQNLERHATPQARRQNYEDSHPTGSAEGLSAALAEYMGRRMGALGVNPQGQFHGGGGQAESPYFGPLTRFGREGQQELQRRAREQQERSSALNVGLPLIGSVNLTPVATAGASLAEKAGVGQALGGVPGHLLNEVLDLPGQSFLSSAMLGSAGRRAIEGKPEQLGELGGSLLHQLEDPVGSFKQAPLSTALIFAGGENVLGRLAGKAARTGLLGDKLASLASQQRAPLALYDAAAEHVPSAEGAPPEAPPGGLVKLQDYNPDPLRKAAQVGYEKLLTSRLLPKEVLGKGVRQADPFVAEGMRLKHNLIGGWVHPGRVDYETNATDLARRGVKGSVVPAIEGLKPKVGAEAVPLIAQRVLRSPATVGEDLLRRKAMLEEAGAGLTRTADKTRNAASLAQVDALLADKAFLADPHEAFAAADRAILHQQPLTGYEMVGGSLRPQQVSAAYHPYKISFMGAKHFSVADHAVAEKAAAAAEGEAAARAAQLHPGSPEHAAALREVAQLRAHRWEVSGRGHPDVQAAHEHAVEQHQAAVQDLKRAEGRLEVERREQARSEGTRLVPRNVERPGFGSRALRRESTAQGRPLLQSAEARVRELAKAEQEARQAVKENPQPPARAGLRTAEGKHLSDQAAREHMLANGVPADEHGRPLVGFLSHQDNAASSSRFYESWMRQPKLHGFTRTGEAFRKGLNDESFGSHVAQLANQAARVSQHEGQSETLQPLIHGNFDSQGEARAAAQEATAVGGRHGEWVAIDKGSLQILKAQAELERQGMADAPARSLAAELAEAGHEGTVPDHVAERVGKYGIIPKEILDRMNDHSKAVSTTNPVRRFLQGYTQTFRHVKFATSPKHAFGIAQEQAIRLLAETPRVGVPFTRGGDRNLGRMVEARLGEMGQARHEGELLNVTPEGAAARKLGGYLSGHGQVSGYGAADIRRTVGGVDVSAKVRGKLLEPVAAKMSDAARAALLGKAVRESGLLGDVRAFRKMEADAQRALLKRNLTPNEADRLARKLNDMHGNWNHLTPLVKASVGSATPFGLWWLNSARWLYRLPVTHPLKAALAASIYSATRDERNAIGQGYQNPTVGSKENPNYLQGSIPVGGLPGLGPSLIEPNRYSPAGLAGPEATNTLAEMFLPQLSGVDAAMHGRNALTQEKATQQSGRELSGPQKGLNALSELLGAGLPSEAISALQGPGHPYGTSNLFTDLIARLGGPPQTKVAPGESLGRTLLKSVDPLRVFKDRKAASGPPLTLEQRIKRQQQEAASPSSAREALLQLAIKRARERR